MTRQARPGWAGSFALFVFVRPAGLTPIDYIIIIQTGGSGVKDRKLEPCLVE